MATRVATGLSAGIVALALVTVGGPVRTEAQATVASDQSAGYVVFAKVVSDPGDVFQTGVASDTVVQLTNTGSAVRVVHCFYVDATSLCTNGTNRFGTSQACRDSSDCTPGGSCAAQWSVDDFTFVLSPVQPVGWSVTQGGVAPPAGGSEGGPLPAVASDYFIGELKCVEVDGSTAVNTTNTPINANDLKGEASIYEVAPGPAGLSLVDVRAYNAIGIQAVSSDGQPQADRTMCLGPASGTPAPGSVCTTAEYAACPRNLILNHRFDESPVVPGGSAVATDLTLVPCSENLDDTGAVRPVLAVQFLVYNEFEQRFSASTRFDCFRSVQLSRIDTRAGNERSSIWNVAVQGTLTGQTRIRPVMGSELDVGRGILAVAEEAQQLAGGPPAAVGSAAFNLNYQATNAGKFDVVVINASSN